MIADGLKELTVATLALNDLLEFKVYCSLGAQLAINVLHYRVTAITGASTTTASAAARLEFLIQAEYKALLVALATFRGVGVKRLFPSTPTIEEFSSIASGLGDVGGDPLPKQSAGIITKQTGLAGRANRGRMYIPFPGEDSNDGDGDPTAAYVGDLGALAAILEVPQTVGTAPNDATIQPILYHRLDGSFTFLTNFLPRNKWGTQRRRGDYGKTNALIP